MKESNMGVISSRREKHVAIVLAGGSGSRMKGTVPKQYMTLLDKPVLYFALKAFEDSFVDEIILVCRPGDENYCQDEIVNKYNIHKVSTITAGGAERYSSVYNGLVKLAQDMEDNKEDMFTTYVYIHDGARACINEKTLEECKKSVLNYNACVPAVAVKDTIKIIDKEGFVDNTPDRSTLMAVQTPQCFRMDIVYEAYIKLAREQGKLSITDDASVVEQYGSTKIRICEGSYENIKITTPEDIDTAIHILGK